MKVVNKTKKMSDESAILFLEEKALQIRKEYVDYVKRIGRSHVGGSLSMCDIVVALFYNFLHWNVFNTEDENRDRFILSKGHCSELLYIIYADLGWCDSEELVSERLKINGMFSGHASKTYLPVIEVSTGALGHGLPIAAGYAHACKVDKKQYRVICLVGDGEIHEGSNWEAIMYAAHRSLNNLIVIVDRNEYSSCKKTDDIIKIEDLQQKFEAFGWDTKRIRGNRMQEVYQCFKEIYSSTSDKPIAIIADTIKGFGLKEAMEHPGEWHNRGIINEKIFEFKEYEDIKNG